MYEENSFTSSTDESIAVEAFRRLSRNAGAVLGDVNW
jgi:histone H3/H4